MNTKCALLTPLFLGAFFVALSCTPKRVERPYKTRAPGISFRQKVGQGLMVGFWGTRCGDDGVRWARGLLRAGEIGGVLIGSRNISSKSQLKSLITCLRKAHSQAFIALDQEGGKVQRLTKAKGFLGLPSASHIATLPVQRVATIYGAHARELSELGVNMNLAPCVDLNPPTGYPVNSAVGALQRSYSSDPKRVSSLAKIMIEAHRARGIISIIKHFPGHGLVLGDSHTTLPTLPNKARPLLKSQLELFRTLFSLSPRLLGVMVGHVLLPHLDPTLPASLSPKLTHGLLRLSLSYQGVILSDDLTMRAIRDRYSLKQSILLAKKAGTDILLFSHAHFWFRAPGKWIAFRQLPSTVVSILEKEAQKAPHLKTILQKNHQRIQNLFQQIN